MLELEGQLLHQQVHVLVNLEPVQVVGVALEDTQVIVVFSFVFAMKKQVLKEKKKQLHLEPHKKAAKGDICREAASSLTRFIALDSKTGSRNVT